jgi:hypothetical protein
MLTVVTPSDLPGNVRHPTFIKAGAHLSPFGTDRLALLLVRRTFGRYSLNFIAPLPRRKAVAMVSRHARVNLACAGYATAYFSGDFETATETVDRAVELNPN